MSIPKAISDQIGRSLGKLVANITGNLRWNVKSATTGAGTAGLLWVRTHKGEKVQVEVSHKASVTDDKQKIAELYVDNEGDYYVVADEKTYRYDQNTNQLHNA